MIGVIILMIIIFVLLLFNFHLVSKLNQQQEESRQFFVYLRRKYDANLESLKEDIRLSDEIIDGYKGMLYERKI